MQNKNFSTEGRNFDLNNSALNFLKEKAKELLVNQAMKNAAEILDNAVNKVKDKITKAKDKSKEIEDEAQDYVESKNELMNFTINNFSKYRNFVAITSALTALGVAKNIINSPAGKAIISSIRSTASNIVNKAQNKSSKMIEAGNKKAKDLVDKSRDKANSMKESANDKYEKAKARLKSKEQKWSQILA